MGAGDVALEVMDGLAASLGAALDECSIPACFVGMYPGSSVVADWCSCSPDRGGSVGCGMAWTRLDRVFPYTNSLTPATGSSSTGGSCDLPLAAVIEVGVYRCLPTLGGRGDAPSAAVQANAVVRQLADIQALHRALTTCPELTTRLTSLGVCNPRDAGGCGGGVWTVTVALTRRR